MFKWLFAAIDRHVTWVSEILPLWVPITLLWSLTVGMIIIVIVRTVRYERSKKYWCREMAYGIKDILGKPVTCEKKKGHDGPHQAFELKSVQW